MRQSRFCSSVSFSTRVVLTPHLHGRGHSAVADASKTLATSAWTYPLRPAGTPTDPSFPRRRIAKHHVALVAYPAPHHAPRDVLRAFRVEHFHSGGIRLVQVGGQSLLGQPVHQRLVQVGHFPHPSLPPLGTSRRHTWARCLCSMK